MLVSELRKREIGAHVAALTAVISSVIDRGLARAVVDITACKIDPIEAIAGSIGAVRNDLNCERAPEGGFLISLLASAFDQGFAAAQKVQRGDVRCDP